MTGSATPRLASRDHALRRRNEVLDLEGMGSLMTESRSERPSTAKSPGSPEALRPVRPAFRACVKGRPSNGRPRRTCPGISPMGRDRGRPGPAARGPQLDLEFVELVATTSTVGRSRSTPGPLGHARGGSSTLKLGLGPDDSPLTSSLTRFKRFSVAAEWTTASLDRLGRGRGARNRGRPGREIPPIRPRGSLGAESGEILDPRAGGLMLEGPSDRAPSRGPSPFREIGRGPGRRPAAMSEVRPWRPPATLRWWRDANGLPALDSIARGSGGKRLASCAWASRDGAKASDGDAAQALGPPRELFPIVTLPSR